ncbi:alpha/beta hydrolase [bacterium]|nr:alpha/beta hydrolase [bacterium]
MTQLATSTQETSTVTSRDGTAIAYERAGSGPALVLVDGAMCSREMGPMAELSEHLITDFTVYRYDRRGRGESGNTHPYDPLREVEDLQALIQAAGGSAHVFGMSSGGVLALEAANRLPGITKLAIYEAPFIVDDTRAPLPEGFVETLEACVAQGRPGDAAKLFMKSVGMPAPLVAVMPFFPGWEKTKKAAATLPHDYRILGGTQAGKPLPRDRWTKIEIPTLVIAGGKSQAWMHNGAKALSELLGAEYQSLPGQTHAVKAQVLAPVLRAFFR